MENETREYIRDYLNGTYTEQELALKFDLIKCPICENYNLEEDMTTHKGDIGELYENWKFAYETDKNILQFIYEIKGDK